MKKHKNGSVTLTAAEIAELNQAYQDMYKLLTDGPGYIGDAFANEPPERLVGIFRWQAQLGVGEFIPADWGIGDDTDYDREFEDWLGEQK